MAPEGQERGKCGRRLRLKKINLKLHHVFFFRWLTIECCCPNQEPLCPPQNGGTKEGGGGEEATN
jgi:hypothetical protein